MARFKMEVQFELETGGETLDADDAGELRDFIVEALETWGGQRHPEDWLFDSLANVRVKMLTQMYQRQREHKIVFRDAPD